jgi:hypothetical protein
MMPRRPLHMLFSASLFFIFFVPLITAAEPETGAGKDRVAAASCQRCGDGYCAPSCENERTCPADCRATKLATPAPAPAAKGAATVRCGRCGDGQCVKSCGETAQTCPADCGVPSAAGAATVQPTECATPADSANPKNDDGR